MGYISKQQLDYQAVVYKLVTHSSPGIASTMARLGNNDGTIDSDHVVADKVANGDAPPSSLPARMEFDTAMLYLLVHSHVCKHVRGSEAF